MIRTYSAFCILICATPDEWHEETGGVYTDDKSQINYNGTIKILKLGQKHQNFHDWVVKFPKKTF